MVKKKSRNVMTAKVNASDECHFAAVNSSIVYPPPRLVGSPRLVVQLERTVLPDELRLLRYFRSLPLDRRVLAWAIIAALAVNTEPPGCRWH